MMKLPKGISRVQVKNEYGKVLWKKPSEVLETDVVQFHPETGDIMVMYQNPGRPASKEIPFIGKGDDLQEETPEDSGDEIIPASGADAETIEDKYGDLPLVPTLSKAELALKALQDRKKQTYKRDMVLRTTKRNSESSKVLDAVLIGLAEEATSIKFEKEELERRGESTAQLSHRRIMALKAVSETWLRKRELTGSDGAIDLGSKEFQALFGFIMETFRIACDDAGARPELVDTIFSRFAEAISDQDWVSDAKTRMEKVKE
jgi:hypothetical protein